MASRWIIAGDANRDNVLRFIAKLSSRKKWQVTVSEYRRNRSLEQNALYHKWVGMIAAETGHAHDEVHEHCKAKFLPPRFVEISGEVHEIRPTTTKLKVDEMSGYMDRVYEWAASDLGMILPLPDDRMFPGTERAA